MDIEQKIKELKQQIKLRQIADDGYFISFQYKEDCRELFELQTKLKASK